MAHLHKSRARKPLVTSGSCYATSGGAYVDEKYQRLYCVTVRERGSFDETHSYELQLSEDEMIETIGAWTAELARRRRDERVKKALDGK